MSFNEYLVDTCGLDQRIAALAGSVEEDIANEFLKIDDIKSVNQLRVIKAMQKYKVSETMFSGTTGYGYDDRGRDTLDLVYADIFGAEKALVRQQIVCGTQALSLCFYGILRPGSTLIYATGRPYDTLEEIIGIEKDESYGKRGTGSLMDFGVQYKQVDLLSDGKIDYDTIAKVMGEKENLIVIQRSGGYEGRAAFTIDEIEEACKRIKAISPSAIIMADNCYGEFVETKEPTQVGIDIAAGSLIKNPGGGIAPTGGYVAGRADLVELAGCRLTSPGLGSHVGPSLGHNRLLYQGLFFAPHVVAESIKGAVFCGKFMQMLGFSVYPEPDAKRGDIIQAIEFGNSDALIAFCQGIQAGSPIDSFIEPQPWDMPGYSNQVIMAAGAFIQGSSIELSVDGPLREPYMAYMQGGLVYEHVKFGVMTAVQKLLEKGIVGL